MAKLALAEPASFNVFCKCRFLVCWIQFRDAVVYDGVQANEIEFLACGRGWAKMSAWILKLFMTLGAGVVARSKIRKKEDTRLERA